MLVYFRNLLFAEIKTLKNKTKQNSFGIEDLNLTNCYLSLQRLKTIMILICGTNRWP